MHTRNVNQPREGANRGHGLPSDRGSRGAANGTPRSASVQPKIESIMMIADEQQQQDDKQQPVFVLGEYIQPPAVVTVDVSEDLLDALISRDKKSFFGFLWQCKTALYGHLLTLMQDEI